MVFLYSHKSKGVVNRNGFILIIFIYTHFRCFIFISYFFFRFFHSFSLFRFSLLLFCLFVERRPSKQQLQQNRIDKKTEKIKINEKEAKTITLIKQSRLKRPSMKAKRNRKNRIRERKARKTRELWKIAFYIITLMENNIRNVFFFFFSTGNSIRNNFDIFFFLFLLFFASQCLCSLPLLPLSLLRAQLSK